jgi:protoporphyrinogen oxidase
MSTYDLIIVGGGIAGLRVGIEALKTNPNINCCILEKYGYIGGRIVTFRKNIPRVGAVQWENGAGRIATTHKKVLHLLKDYGLTFIPIGNESSFINEKTGAITENKFSDLIQFYFGPIEELSSDMLATHTLSELLNKTIGLVAAKKLYEQFPYYSEIHTLRADVALESFKKEMGATSGFGVVKEGFSSLTNAMMDEFTSLGGKVIIDVDAYKVASNHDNSVTINCRIRNTNTKTSYTGKAVVLALHHSALTKIEGVNTLSVLRHLTMMPLLRIYAVFPTKNGVSWFSNYKKIVTNSRIRYIIPVDPKRGIVMISYTDGLDAKWWFKQNIDDNGDNDVKEIVMTKIRKLFPELNIPDPIFFKQHPWYDGCTYWLPGAYNVEDESNKSLHPRPKSMPNLFMCGESFAVKQCWVESALVQADKLLDSDTFKRAIKGL